MNHADELKKKGLYTHRRDFFGGDEVKLENVRRYEILTFFFFF